MADGWMPSLSYLPIDPLGEATSRIDQAAADAGRDPASLRKVYNLNGIIGTESADPFRGSPDQWVEEVVRLVQVFGMNAFSFWPETDPQDQIRRFAELVVP